MTLDPKFYEIMRKNPLFMDLCEQRFLQIVEGTICSKLKTGETLFRQFQPATDFFLVVQGKIKISLLSIEGTEKVVDIINEGNTFAEAIIFKGMNGYPVNSEALSDVTVLRINAERYIEILRSSPEACFKVMGCLSTRVHWLMNEMERLSLHNATYRLISFLLENIPEERETQVEVTLSAPKHVIASRISITPETLSRTLKALSKKGLLEVHDSHITLLDPAELRHIVSIG